MTEIDSSGRRRPLRGVARTLHISPTDGTPTEIVCYRIFAGDELLFERRDTPEVVARLREQCEPLRAGQRATLGSGKNHDPDCASGPPASAEDLELRRSADWHRLNLRINEDLLEFGKFQRQFLVDSLAEIAAERDKAEARLQRQLAASEQRARTPLISAESLRELTHQIAPVVGEFVKVYRNIKGTNNGG